MPREKSHDLKLLLIDVGKTSSESGFADSAFKLASQFVQRKVYSEVNDCFGIVLIGTKGTDNPLNRGNVTIANYNNGVFSSANYDVLKYLDHHIKAEKSSYNNSDWIAGLEVSIDYIKRHVEKSPGPVGDKAIAIFSDLGCPSRFEEKFDSLVEKVANSGIGIHLFGPEVLFDNKEGDIQSEQNVNGDQKSKTKEQENNANFVINIVNSSGGVCGDISTCAIEFAKMDRKKKKPMAWKADLEIGPDIRINITGYINLRREAPKLWKNCLTHDNGEVCEVKPVTTFVRNNEEQDTVELDNLMESFKYGSQQITVNDADKNQQGFKEDGKSIRVIGFVPKEKIPKNKLLGDGNMVFFPTEGDANSMSALPPLMKAMNQENVVALVRRVYQKNGTPKLGLLIPEENSKFGQCMAFVELPFMEDIRSYPFAPLSIDTVKQEQLDAVDELIDDLLVVDSEETDEKENVLRVEPKEVLNPYYQHLYACLTHRVLHPGRILPEPEESINLSMSQPKELKEKSEKSLSKIKDLFKLELLISKKNKITGDEVFGGDTNGSKRKNEPDNDENDSKKVRQSLTLADPGPSIGTIGTVTPVEDFKMLLEGGIQFAAVVVQMQNVIIKLLSDSLGDQFNDKIQKCIEIFRQATLEKKNSAHFNHFVSELKQTMISQKAFSLWQKLVDENLTLISSLEDSGSTFSDNDVLEFGKIELTKQVAEENDDDLLDQL